MSVHMRGCICGWEVRSEVELLLEILGQLTQLLQIRPGW